MKIKTIYILTVIILFFGLSSFSQNNTLFFMDRLPQNNDLNPAFHFNGNTYVGFPALSSIQFKYSNSAFNYTDIFKKGTGDKLDTSVVNLSSIAKTLHKKNFINIQTAVQVLAFGFKKNDIFFNFSLNVKANAMAQFPSSALDFRFGNYDPVKKEALPIDFSNINLSGTAYAELAFGASKEISSNLTVGAKVKFLSGVANVKTQKTDILLTTKLDASGQAESITADVDIDIRTASVPIDVSYDEEGLPEGIEINEDRMADDVKGYVDMFLLNGSWGLAFDLGATYQLAPKIQLSASALDLGWIRWKSETKQLTAKTSFTFKGLEIVPDAEGKIDIDTITELLLDSVLNSLEINDTNEAYTTATVPKLIIGGNYKLNDYFSLGAMFRTDFYGKGPRFSSSLSATASFAKRWQATTSYSFMHNAYNNWGVGLSMNAGFFNFYLLADNIPTRRASVKDSGIPFAIVPLYAQTLSVRLGFNFLFGYKNKIDKPSIEINDILLLE